MKTTLHLQIALGMVLSIQVFTVAKVRYQPLWKIS